MPWTRNSTDALRGLLTYACRTMITTFELLDVDLFFLGDVSCFRRPFDDAHQTGQASSGSKMFHLQICTANARK